MSLVNEIDGSIEMPLKPGTDIQRSMFRSHASASPARSMPANATKRSG